MPSPRCRPRDCNGYWLTGCWAGTKIIKAGSARYRLAKVAIGNIVEMVLDSLYSPYLVGWELGIVNGLMNCLKLQAEDEAVPWSTLEAMLLEGLCGVLGTDGHWPEEQMVGCPFIASQLPSPPIGEFGTHVVLPCRGASLVIPRFPWIRRIDRAASCRGLEVRLLGCCLIDN